MQFSRTRASSWVIGPLKDNLNARLLTLYRSLSPNASTMRVLTLVLVMVGCSAPVVLLFVDFPYPSSTCVCPFISCFFAFWFLPCFLPPFPPIYSVYFSICIPSSFLFTLILLPSLFIGFLLSIFFLRLFVLFLICSLYSLSSPGSLNPFFLFFFFLFCHPPLLPPPLFLPSLVWILADGHLSHIWDSSHSGAAGWLGRPGLKLNSVLLQLPCLCSAPLSPGVCHRPFLLLLSSSGVSSLMGCLLSNKCERACTLQNPWVPVTFYIVTLQWANVYRCSQSSSRSPTLNWKTWNWSQCGGFIYLFFFPLQFTSLDWFILACSCSPVTWNSVKLPKFYYNQMRGLRGRMVNVFWELESLMGGWLAPGVSGVLHLMMCYSSHEAYWETCLGNFSHVRWGMWCILCFYEGKVCVFVHSVMRLYTYLPLFACV